MTAIDTATVSPVGEAFASLSELQHEHVALMRVVRASPREARADLIHTFLRRAQATGCRLDEVSERDAAQSILDYWMIALIDLRDGAGDLPGSPVLAEYDISQADDLAGRPSPFKGLSAFGESDADWFFGREDAVKLLMEVIARERLVMVAGPSGSGKSSLVLAGLVPHLKRGALFGRASWRYLPTVTPGSDPLLSLLQAVRPGERDALSWSAEHKPKLERSPSHFRKLLEAVHAAGDGPALLIVDQFEELFTLCTDQPARTSFIEAILSIVQPEDQNRVILTLREDFLAQAKQLPALRDPKLLFRLPPFTTRELRRVIVEPAERIGLKIHESIVDDLVKEVVGDPAALPLLQFTLKQLWDHRERNRITWDIYQKVGRPSEALKRTADEVFEGLKTFENQKAAERIFLALVQPGVGAEFLRRRVFRETLEGLEAADRVDHVLKPFVDAGLIIETIGIEHCEDRFEVAHETLIRNWPRLAKWLAGRKAQSQEILELNVTAQRWQQSGRKKGYLFSGDALAEAKRFRDAPELKEFIEASEKTERERKRLLLILISVLIFCFSVAGYSWAIIYRAQRNYANEQRANAEQQSKNAFDALIYVSTKFKIQLDTGTISIAAEGPLLEALVDTDTKLFEGVKLAPGPIADRIKLLRSYSDAYDDIGERDKALAIAKKAKKIAEELSKSNPDDKQFKHFIYDTAFRIGDQLVMGGLEGQKQAEKEYGDALSIAEELASNDAKSRSDVAFVRLKVGDVDKLSGRLEKSLEEYRNAQKIYEELADIDKGNLRNGRNVAVAQIRIADALVAAAREKAPEKEKGVALQDEAEEKYRSAIKSLEEIVASDKTYMVAKSNLSAALRSLALFYKGEDKLDDALTRFGESLKIRRELSAEYKSYAAFQKGVAEVYWNVGEVLTAKAAKVNDEAEARKLRQQAVEKYNEGLAVGRKFLETSPNVSFERKLNQAQEKVLSLGSATP